jgi:predicted ester cyclase
MTRTPEALVRRLIEEGFNEGNVDVADELIADDLVEHQWYGPDHAPGPEGVKAVIRSLRRAFSDFRLEIEAVTVADDTVWLRMTSSGTNDGPFMGNEPTGRTMRTPVFDSLRVKNGMIVEHWGVPDRLYALIQLGLLQPPAPRVAA